MSSKIGLVIQREYMERVAKKSFIITTILMPLLMLLLMVIPAIIMAVAGPSETTVLVIDKSGVIAPGLESSEDLKFEPVTVPLDSALAREDASAVLVIPQNVVTAKDLNLKYYVNGTSSVMTEGDITRQINGIIETQRLKEYNIDNLQQILDDVESNVSLATVRTDREEEENISSGVSYGLGIAMTFILYMFLLIYGQMISTSIIEEKNNRVLELIVSSVKPTQLMLGKIAGVGLVALTQIVIWAVLIVLMAGFLLPAILPADLMTDVTAMQAGDLGSISGQNEIELVQAVSIISSVGYLVKMMVLMTLFLITGFLFYATISAAIGSAVDNIQDLGQLQIFNVIPIVFGFIFAMTASNDPSSGVAFWTSIIPLTSPMVMVARIPFGIPGWEIALSLFLLIISTYGMIWVAAKIYRVGIFMYGKKPTIKEIIRWINYK
jgi:hypothetical protein